MRAVGALALAATLALAWNARADEATFRKNVDDYWVYLAVMPAEMVTRPAPSADQLAANPAAPPRDTHHLMVSLFDYRSGHRVTDSDVEARVATLGFSGIKKRLEPETVAGATLYTAFFPMQGRGPFRVDVEFRASGALGSKHATFYFSHPRFGKPKHKGKGKNL